MGIDALLIGNFKGIKDFTHFEIKPLTFFIGPNSSGKSSCIHGLGSLAQTVKMSNSQQPLILDGDYAQLNLGRFIEIIHSKDYDDEIALGIEIKNIGTPTVPVSGSEEEIQLQPHHTCKVKYYFKCSKKQQNIFITTASIEILDGKKIIYSLNLKKKDKSPSKKDYIATTSNGLTMPAVVQDGFMFQLSFSGTHARSSKHLDTFFLLQHIQRELVENLKNCVYLGPFREAPSRRYPTKGAKPFEVGPSGGAAVTMLVNESVESSRNRPHGLKVSKWLTHMGLASGVAVSRMGTSDLFDVSVQLKDGATLPIADLGYGLSQILPVLVQCAFANNNATLLFEQPELHLHQGAAEKLAQVFIDTIKEKNVRIVAETHSRELFSQTIREINAGKINANDVVAYTVERIGGSSKFKRIQFDIDKRGHVETIDPWVTPLTR
jgi:AAA15 family ATPase/GTPase